MGANAIDDQRQQQKNEPALQVSIFPGFGQLRCAGYHVLSS
jgi:hypothetical protein